MTCLKCVYVIKWHRINGSDAMVGSSRKKRNMQDLQIGTYFPTRYTQTHKNPLNEIIKFVSVCNATAHHMDVIHIHRQFILN